MVKRYRFRLEIQGPLVRFPAGTYIFILNVSLMSLSYSSVDPLPMKSSMAIHLYFVVIFVLDSKYH